MINNIHRWLILRLAIVWLCLTMVIGGVVEFLGHSRLDEHIVTMAQGETSHYARDFASYLQAPSAEALSQFQQTIRRLIEKDNVIVVEFYGADSQKIAEAVKPQAMESEKRLPKHNTDFLRAEGGICEKLTVNGTIFMRVFVPIVDASKAKIGYLEGIYHAPDEIVQQNQRETLWALILVVVVVFATALALYPLILRLNRKLLDYARILALTNIGMLKVLGSAIAKRDSDTNTHNYRVTLYAVRLGECLHLNQQAMQGLIKGAFLHDVGKIAITDAILLKPGKLTADEFEVMKTHVRHGQDILSSYDWLQDADEVVRCHHEKFDGSGYLQAVKGEAIPLNARIFAIVDVFDALTSKRPYKEPFSLATSLAIIRESRGSHFDPAIVDLFLEQAEGLYQEICHEDEALLHGKLEACIKTCFH